MNTSKRINKIDSSSPNATGGSTGGESLTAFYAHAHHMVDTAISLGEDSTGGSVYEDGSNVQDPANNSTATDVKQTSTTGGTIPTLRHDDTAPLDIKKSLLLTNRVMVIRGMHEHSIAATYYGIRHNTFVFMPLAILVGFDILNSVKPI